MKKTEILTVLRCRTGWGDRESAALSDSEWAAFVSEGERLESEAAAAAAAEKVGVCPCMRSVRACVRRRL